MATLHESAKDFLGHLERLVMRLPNARERLALARARFRELGARRSDTMVASR